MTTKRVASGMKNAVEGIELMLERGVFRGGKKAALKFAVRRKDLWAKSHKERSFSRLLTFVRLETARCQLAPMIVDVKRVGL